MPNKPSQIEFSLLLAAILALAYAVFIHYVYWKGWNHTVLIAVMELVTIPMILMGCAVPVFVVYRFIRKKTTHRTLAILTLFLSLLFALLLGYASS